MLKKEYLKFDEKETEILLSSAPENLPPEILKKLSDYGLMEIFLPLLGRNINLAINALEN